MEFMTLIKDAFATVICEKRVSVYIYVTVSGILGLVELKVGNLVLNIFFLIF